MIELAIEGAYAKVISTVFASIPWNVGGGDPGSVLVSETGLEQPILSVKKSNKIRLQ